LKSAAALPARGPARKFWRAQRARQPSRQDIAIQNSAAPIRDRDGRTVGAVVVFRDVTKERRLKRALSFQASHDA